MSGVSNDVQNDNCIVCKSEVTQVPETSFNFCSSCFHHTCNSFRNSGVTFSSFSLGNDCVIFKSQHTSDTPCTFPQVMHEALTQGCKRVSSVIMYNIIQFIIHPEEILAYVVPRCDVLFIHCTTLPTTSSLGLLHMVSLFSTNSLKRLCERLGFTLVNVYQNNDKYIFEVRERWNGKSNTIDQLYREIELGMYGNVQGN